MHARRPAAGSFRDRDPAARHACKLHTRNRNPANAVDARAFEHPAALPQAKATMAQPYEPVDGSASPRRKRILVALAAHFPGKTMTVVSGYRDPRVRTSSAHRSNHTRGRAIDLRIEGVSNRALRDLVRRSFEGVGIGYYPNSSFVHIDIRERSAQWIDFAGPGQAACYSKTVRADLDSGTAERLTYIEAKRRGCK